MNFLKEVRMTSPILVAEGVSKQYSRGGRQIQVLSEVSLAIESGEFVVVAGSSGSGKTTLLSILSGLDSPTSGRVVACGRDITGLSEDQLAPLRNRLTGFVFQAFHLIPSLNALENVMFPAELNKDAKARDKALALLERVGLAARATNFPEQLSGGEQQRVAICRAVINGPELLFADEPTGNLDSRNSEGIIELLLELHRNHGTTLVLATHSPALAARADRIIRLHDGVVSSSADRSL
jgi:putative ABC transport system ATP-binding protein